jgi:hypothetical protein
MKFNLNAKIRVTLTKEGARIYNKHWITAPNKYRPLEVAVGDDVELELWRMAQIFGQDFYNGAAEVPFVDNRIEIVTGVEMVGWLITTPEMKNAWLETNAARKAHFELPGQGHTIESLYKEKSL